jgi:hypothetical protein
MRFLKGKISERIQQRPPDPDFPRETSRVPKEKEEKQYGEYRTSVILEIYDEMAEAMRGGTSYQTRLNPPPADPHCCHLRKEGIQ